MINASTLLDIWETGLTAAPVERMFLLIGAGCPELSPEQIGRLTLGEKETQLLLLRERLFGSTLECVADCRRCGELLEFGFSAADIGAADYHPRREPMEADGGLTVRPLTLDDLRSARGSGRQLLACAIGQTDRERIPATLDALPAEAISQVTASLQELDPLMNIYLDLLCPGCGDRWSAPFEAISYLWAEIERWGAHLLRTVHRMAATYGWAERDILAMSAWRRQRYVEMIA